MNQAVKYTFNSITNFFRTCHPCLLKILVINILFNCCLSFVFLKLSHTASKNFSDMLNTYEQILYVVTFISFPLMSCFLFKIEFIETKSRPGFLAFIFSIPARVWKLYTFQLLLVVILLSFHQFDSTYSFLNPFKLPFSWVILLILTSLIMLIVFFEERKMLSVISNYGIAIGMVISIFSMYWIVLGWLGLLAYAILKLLGMASFFINDITCFFVSVIKSVLTMSLLSLISFYSMFYVFNKKLINNKLSRFDSSDHGSDVIPTNSISTP